jgi:hypothetical protein
VELKVGNTIRIMAKVTSVFPGTETCNLNADIIEPGQAPEGVSRSLYLTASLVERVDPDMNMGSLPDQKPAPDSPPPDSPPPPDPNPAEGPAV